MAIPRLRLGASLADVGLEPGVGIKNFLLVVRTAFVKNDVANHDQKLLTLPGKTAGQRMLPGDVYEPLTHPLPELLLSGPELVVVGAHDPSSLFRATLGWR